MRRMYQSTWYYLFGVDKEPINVSYSGHAYIILSQPVGFDQLSGILYGVAGDFCSGKAKQLVKQ